MDNRNSKEYLNKMGHKNSNPVKAIRKLCVEECMCGSYKNVENCPSINCPLFPFRLGKNLLRKEMSEKRRLELSKNAIKNFGGKND